VGSHLVIGMQMSDAGIGSLLVSSGSRLWVLHASAALGTGIFRSSKERWRRTQDFSWECRDPADGPCRDAFKRREGWVANVSEVGSDRLFELDLSRFAVANEAVVHFAITYFILSPSRVVAWPEAVDSDVLSEELQAGQLPLFVHVRPDRWATVVIPIEGDLRS
jgi:hypothetical protein